MPIAKNDAGEFVILNPEGQWVPAMRAVNPETKEQLLFDGREWIAEPKPSRPEPEKSIGRSLGLGARGVLESISSLVAPAIDVAQIPYSGISAGARMAGFDMPAPVSGADRVRGMIDATGLPQAETTRERIGNAVISGAASALPTMGAGFALNALGVAPNIARALMTAPITQAVGGAAGGATAEGVTEATGSPMAGAGAGMAAALLAGAAPYVGSGARDFGRRLATGAGFGDADASAQRDMIRTISRDIPASGGASSLDQLAGRAALASDPIMLPDIAGRNTIGRAALVSRSPGTGADMADRLIQNRIEARPDRMASIVDQTLGGGAGRDVADQVAALSAQRTRDAAPLYREAFNKPAGFTDAMGTVLDDPITRAGLARGLEIQRIENTTRAASGMERVPTTDPAIRFGDDGVPRIVGVPNMRSLDAVKRGLDAIIDDARSPTTGMIQWTERLRAIDGLRAQWVRMLDDGNDTYRAARAAWAGPSSAMDAVTLGRKALTTDRDMVARSAANTSEGNFPFLQLGFGRAVTDAASDPPRAGGFARRLTSDRQMAGRLEALIPDPEVRRTFLSGMRREAEMANVERAISPRAGSITQPLQAQAEDMGSTALEGAFKGARHGGMTGAAAAVLENLMNRGKGLNPKTMDRMAEYLFTPDVETMRGGIQRLQAREISDALAAEHRAALARSLMIGTSLGAQSR